MRNHNTAWLISQILNVMVLVSKLVPARFRMGYSNDRRSNAHLVRRKTRISRCPRKESNECGLSLRDQETEGHMKARGKQKMSRKKRMKKQRNTRGENEKKMTEYSLPAQHPASS